MIIKLRAFRSPSRARLGYTCVFAHPRARDRKAIIESRVGIHRRAIRQFGRLNFVKSCVWEAGFAGRRESAAYMVLHAVSDD